MAGHCTLAIVPSRLPISLSTRRLVASVDEDRIFRTFLAPFSSHLLFFFSLFISFVLCDLFFASIPFVSVSSDSLPPRFFLVSVFPSAGRGSDNPDSPVQVWFGNAIDKEQQFTRNFTNHTDESRENAQTDVGVSSSSVASRPGVFRFSSSRLLTLPQNTALRPPVIRQRVAVSLLKASFVPLFLSSVWSHTGLSGRIRPDLVPDKPIPDQP